MKVRMLVNSHVGPAGTVTDVSKAEGEHLVAWQFAVAHKASDVVPEVPADTAEEPGLVTAPPPVIEGDANDTAAQPQPSPRRTRRKTN